MKITRMISNLDSVQSPVARIQAVSTSVTVGLRTDSQYFKLNIYYSF